MNRRENGPQHPLNGFAGNVWVLPDLGDVSQGAQERLDGASLPAKGLVEKRAPALDRGPAHPRLGHGLDGNVPVVLLEPPRREGVVARVQLEPPEPVVVGQAVQEPGVPEDLAPEQDRRPGQHPAPPGDGVHGREAAVPPPEGPRHGRLPGGHVPAVPALRRDVHGERRPDRPDRLVVEAGQRALEERLGPEDVVVDVDDDAPRGRLDAQLELLALARRRRKQQPDLRRGVGRQRRVPDQVRDVLALLLDANDDNLARLVGGPCPEAPGKRRLGADRRHDDADVRRGQLEARAADLPLHRPVPLGRAGQDPVVNVSPEPVTAVS